MKSILLALAGPLLVIVVEPAPAAVAQETARLTPVLAKADRKYVYIDATGKIILPGPYSAAGPFGDGVAIVSVEGADRQIIDGAGKPLATVERRLEIEGEFREGLIKVREQPAKSDPCNQGYMDKSGKIVIRCSVPHKGYSCFLGRFSGGRAIQGVKSGTERFGIIDASGKIVLAPSYDLIGEFSEGLAGFHREPREPYGYLKLDGTVAIEPKYQKVQSFSEGLAWVLQDDLWSAINPKGNVVIPAKFLNAHPFEGGVAPVLLGGDGPNSKTRVWALVDKKGKIVHQGQYDYVAAFSEGLAPFSKDGETWGWLDAKGKIAIPPQWKTMPPPFRFGLAVNDTGQTKTYVNKSGKVVWGP
jgi:hypothetical protein